MDAPRHKQETPDDLVGRLAGIIRGQFCGDATDKEWYKDHYPFIRRNVILWPAYKICNRHGFTLPARRYEQIMLEIFHGIKAHGQTASIQYWPAYLMKCVQEHWNHHWEEYYAESKAMSHLSTAALMALKQLPAQDRTVEVLAATHRVLTAARRKTRKSNSSPIQGTLF